MRDTFDDRPSLAELHYLPGLIHGCGGEVTARDECGGPDTLSCPECDRTVSRDECEPVGSSDPCPVCTDPTSVGEPCDACWRDRIAA